MNHAPRRTHGSGKDPEFTVAPDPDGSPDTDIKEDFEEHVPDEVHSDPELWFDICNDPAIWPENKAAAYRAALRGDRNWQFAFDDEQPDAPEREKVNAGANVNGWTSHPRPLTEKEPS